MNILMLFILLAILYCLEASTNIARKAGYNINNPSAGLFFQSGLSIFSRLVMFIFMPLIGFLSDTKSLDLDLSLLGFLIVPISILFLYKRKVFIEKIFGKIILSLSENGSYFKISKTKYKPLFSRSRNFFSKKFKILYILANIPYVLSWPIIIIAIIKFVEYRATIIGCSAFLNGLYTVYLNLFVDPLLSRLGQSKNVINVVYDELLYLKVISSGIAVIIYFSVVYAVFLW